MYFNYKISLFNVSVETVLSMYIIYNIFLFKYIYVDELFKWF